MIRDTFFNFRRFASLCRKGLVENWKSTLLRFLMIYGIMTVLFLWMGYFRYVHADYYSPYWEHRDPMWDAALGIFVYGFFLAGLLSASFTFSAMKSKVGRLTVLMQPATQFEKFMVRWLAYTLGFVLVYVLAFKLADCTRVLVYASAYPKIEEIGLMPWSHFQTWEVFQECRDTFVLITFYCFAQSLFVLGSAVWPKNSFVKTCAAIVVIGLAYTVAGVMLGKLLFAHRYVTEHGSIFADEDLVKNGALILFSLMALFNWTLAYHRFKESEIINRW